LKLISLSLSPIDRSDFEDLGVRSVNRFSIVLDQYYQKSAVMCNRKHG
jgi:hypothetical protein